MEVFLSCSFLLSKRAPSGWKPLLTGIPTHQTPCSLIANQTQVTTPASPKPWACCWPCSFLARHSQALCLLLPTHGLKQKGQDNPSGGLLSVWVLLGLEAEGIPQSACQAGAFCWPSRATARCQPKSADPREKARLTCQLQTQVTSQSLSVTRSCCCPIKCRDRSDLPVPFRDTFLLLRYEPQRQKWPHSPCHSHIAPPGAGDPEAELTSL